MGASAKIVQARETHCLKPQVELQRDPSRLVIKFREKHEREKIRTRLKPPGVCLEECEEELGSDCPYFAKRVNHTERHYWVRAQAVDQLRLNQNLDTVLAGDLEGDVEWIAPVYTAPGSSHGECGVCVLPNTLIIKPKEEHRKKKQLQNLNMTLRKDFGLRFVPKISRYLAGYRYYYLDRKATERSPQYSVFDILEEIQSNNKYQSFVEDAQFDYIPLFTPTAELKLDDPYYNGTTSTQWNLKQIHAEQGWLAAGWSNGQAFTPGKGVVVAVIDSGVDRSHPDLKGAFTGGATFRPGPGFDYTRGEGHVVIDEFPRDQNAGGTITGDDPHGTLCAGIIGARSSNGEGIAGLAGSCLIMPIKLEGWHRSTVAAAISYAAQKGADVITMSFGGDRAKGDYLDGTLVASVIKEAYEKYKVVLCAATMNTDENLLRYPAKHEDVIACGASDQQDIRCQNNWPVTVGPGSNHGEGLSVVAPGVAIPSTFMVSRTPYTESPYTKSFGGTSAATPHVAALAALLISRYLKLKKNPTKVREVIERSALRVHDHNLNSNGRYQYDVNDPNGKPYPHGPWNNEMGYGRIDVEAAFDVAKNMQLDGP